jgi:glyoxylase-like metal-dependent hydrolase (beta-lactamase superfamily II)
VQQIEPDITLFRGDAVESVATAFVHRGEALLVDTLASDADAAAMRRYIRDQLRARVRRIVMTHYMNDHMAGLRLYPDAEIVAQRYFMHTYLSQRERSVADDDAFVAPTTTFSDSLAFRWGRRDLRLFHNPGKNMCDAVVDVPDAGLVLCGDALVGHIAYLGTGAPELIDDALARLQRLGRGRVVPGHIGLLDGEAFAHARHYLRRLRAHTADSRHASPASLAALPIEACLAEGLAPRPFEREWHGRNLAVIGERHVFALPVTPAPPPAGHARDALPA